MTEIKREGDTHFSFPLLSGLSCIFFSVHLSRIVIFIEDVVYSRVTSLNTGEVTSVAD